MVLYRLLLTLSMPLLLAGLLYRCLRGAETFSGLRERLGGVPEAAGGHWVHAASVGELTAARRVIEALAQDGPVHVTCNTALGRAHCAGFGIDGVSVSLAPLDLNWILRRFLTTLRPAALTVVENELWPNRLAQARGRCIPVTVISARLSERSAARWAKLPGLARMTLQKISALSAQDAESASRLTALGLPEAALGAVFSLKASVTLPQLDPEVARAIDPFRAGEPGALLVLAASTHPGDEALILEAFARALSTRPNLRLILAPRHPKRGAEVAQILRQQGLPFAQRSKFDPITEETRVYLADTLGEMGTWMRVAPLTILGGGWSDRGGHTPYEPASAGSAILHGPDTANHRAIFAQLDATGAALETKDADALAKALTTLTKADLDTMQTKARDIVSRPHDPEPILAMIKGAKCSQKKS